MAFVCLLVAAQAAMGQLMIPDVTNARVMLVDEFDGSLLDDRFIDMSSLGGNPVNAVRVGEEIWVSNQTNRTIHRFDERGSYLGDVAGAMDYVRGFAVVGDRVFAANAGQVTGHPERTGVLVIDVATASVVDFFPIGSDGEGFGFDVLPFVQGNETRLLIPDQSSTDEGLDDGEDIDWFDLDGTFLGTFHDSDGVTGIDNPMQLVDTGEGTVVAAGFTGSLFGIFEYDPAGEQIDFALLPGTNVYGVSPLANGNMLFTTFEGVFVLDTARATVTSVVSDRWAGFIEPLNPGGEPNHCPGDLDGDGTVSFPDLVALLSRWGPCEPGETGDLDGNGEVGFVDLLGMLQAWGPCR
ncbi:MAG: hypothetical protein HKO59_10425 [Phycisphaerales bacterium]|nr:hypothetical protein [Phycisphaerales bacterium]